MLKKEKRLFINPDQFHFVSLIKQVLHKGLRAIKLWARRGGGALFVLHTHHVCKYTKNRCVSLISDVGVINAVCQR